MDHIRLLGHGAAGGGDSESEELESYESSKLDREYQRKQQEKLEKIEMAKVKKELETKIEQKRKVEKMTTDVAKFRKELEAKNEQESKGTKKHQEEVQKLNAELKSLQEQAAQSKKDFEAETNNKQGKETQDKAANQEVQMEMEALKLQLGAFEAQELASQKGLSDAKAKEEERSRLQAESVKELEALQKELKELKAEKQSAVEVAEYPYAKPPAASEFVKQEGVFIATKIHGTHQLFIVKQFLCLLNFAYNKKMKYDVVIFTTIALTKEEERELQQIGKPAKVFIVVDNPGLHELIDELEPHKKEKFLKKCKVDKDPEALKNLTWFSDCKENGRSSRLAYNWQAEFRALRIWENPALKPYKYMLWIDADAFCTEEWKRDPVAFFIEHKLVILFANFGAGTTPGGYPEFMSRFMTSFNRTISDVTLEEGHLTSKNDTGAVRQIHGFMHITDLDFFRSEPVMHWAQTLIGDEFLSRRFDDQLAVTAPTVVLAPNRSWDMRQNGITLNVFHNGKYDGQEKAPAFNFLSYWNQKGGDAKMPGSKEACEITANG